jgi:hypothetical protein
MALKTYPETPAEEAARINRASGDPEGITAEQVARNRALNESLTAGFGFGGSGASSNPLANLVSNISSAVKQASDGAAAKLPADSSIISKDKLDSTVNRLSGALGSGLNGLSAAAGGQASAFASEARGLVDKAGVGGVTTALGGVVNQVSSSFTSGVSTLKSAAGSISNVAADIQGSLNKLTGGNLGSGIGSLAGTISGAAGQLNNILSKFRGVNLPQGAELFVKQGSAIKLQPNSKNDWRVRITCDWTSFGSNALFAELAKTNGVVWPYLPNITVSTKANYTQVDTIHNNYPFFAYKNSQVDEINITGDFTCETETDAAYWIAATTFFKTATKMFFGASSNAGNPPIICRLNGYGSSIFNEVPVIVKSFSVDLKDDVNYIRCNTFGTNTWVPVVSSISVTVSPIYNRENLRKFKLQDYAQGKMTGSSGVGYI